MVGTQLMDIVAAVQVIPLGELYILGWLLATPFVPQAITKAEPVQVMLVGHIGLVAA